VLTYVILFAIVFAETGLIILPFLPGDSLLFACGALAALGALHLPLLIGLLIVAAVLGDAVNYTVGARVGRKVVRLIDEAHLRKAEAFYIKYGGKAVLLARFLPILRTFAPFVAGVGRMHYSRFASYNVGGAVLWVCTFTLAGFFFGTLPVVQRNFSLVVLGIVGISLVPVAFELVAARIQQPCRQATSHLRSV